MSIRLSYAAAAAALNAIHALIDVGAGTAVLQLWSGAQPADPSVAITSQVKLVEYPLSSPAFGQAVQVTNAAKAMAAALPSVVPIANGTVTWFRVLDKNGLAIMDGSVSAYGGTGALLMASTAVTTSAPAVITSWSATLPQ